MRIGEIIHTTSTGFTAESFQLLKPPPLGSLVKVRSEGLREIFAVVSFGETGSIEPGRRAVRFSQENIYDESIYQEHPELTRTLRTEFAAVLVGEIDGQEILQGLPSQPPPLHYSVQDCTPEEVVRFTQNLYYLRLLWSAAGPVLPEHLLAAHLRQVFQERDDDREWLALAAREVAGLLKQNYDRLMTVLLGIEPRGG